MEDTVGRSRSLLVPKGEISMPTGLEVLLEKQNYSLITKNKIRTDEIFTVISMAPLDFEEENRPQIFSTYVRECKDILSKKGMDSDYIFICSSGSFLQTRSAVIAAKETVKDAKVFPLMQFDDSEISADGWDALAQFITLQAMGCDGVLIDCRDGEALHDILEDITPYARIPVAIWTDSLENVDKTLFDKADCLVLKESADDESVREIACKMGFFDADRAKHGPNDDILAVSNGEIWFIDSDMDISDAIICDEELSDSILESENEDSFILKLDISTEDELDIFETTQYMIKNPVCIYSEDESIFERAVRMFCGTVIYDGTCDISDGVLNKLANQYGLIIL